MLHKTNVVEPIAFQCNICGMRNRVARAELGRETPSCTSCGSTVRMRSMIYMLTRELFGRSLCISDIPVLPEIKGVGMSCWHGYAGRLSHRLGFTNTYYHQEPLLDITDIPSHLRGALDFITSTDVFEHVAPPVSAAFANARALLKPGGVFLFSVPYSHVDDKSIETLEHFPELHRYELLETDTRWRLRNTTRGGQIQEFDQLVFHGGDGTTLEMRVFSYGSMLRGLRAAGFDDVTIYRRPYLDHGIYWQSNNSVPLAARSIGGMWRKLFPACRVR